jgi:hypothetical protein
LRSELRCGSKKFGELLDDDVIEIKCSSKFCGAGPGVIVLHQFDRQGKLIETRKLADPPSIERRKDGA